MGHIGVIGSGIAGLSSAIACARAGYKVTVIGPTPLAIYGALQLAPNGFQALTALGLDEVIAPHVMRLDSIELRYARSNACLSVIDHDKPVRRAYGAIGRAHLHQTLMKRATTDPLITLKDEMVTSLRCEPDITSATTEQNHYDFDLMIGADGQKGLARTYMGSVGNQPITRQALRAVTAADTLPHAFSAPRTQLWLGQGFHLVSYPFDEGNYVNLVLCTSASDKAPHRMAATHLAHNKVLSCLADEDVTWHKTALPSAGQLASWRKHQLILTGDAAHFMPPHLAQGAGQTLEDAASLGKALAETDELSQAARQWAVQRARTLAPIIQRAETTGAVMRLSGPMARLRDAAIEVGGQRLIEQWLKQVWQ